MRIKSSLTILSMILGVAATGLVTAVSMSETALAAGTGGGCGTGGCGGSKSDIGLTDSGFTGGFGNGGSNDHNGIGNGGIGNGDLHCGSGSGYGSSC